MKKKFLIVILLIIFPVEVNTLIVECKCIYMYNHGICMVYVGLFHTLLCILRILNSVCI